MRVKARAVIWIDGRLILAEQSRQGRPELTLPGGRVNDHESVIDAVRREVAEETGLQVALKQLLYISQVPGDAGHHDLELIFLAEATGVPRLSRSLKAVAVTDASQPAVRPPILEQIAADARSRWRDTPRWLQAGPRDR